MRQGLITMIRNKGFILLIASLASVCWCSALVEANSRFGYSPGEDRSSFNYYTTNGLDDSASLPNFDGLFGLSSLPHETSYLINEAPQQNQLAYLIDTSNNYQPIAGSHLDARDAKKLTDFIIERLEKQQQQDGTGVDDSYFATSSGASRHLDSSNESPAVVDLISGPVNDPAEFKTATGYLATASGRESVNPANRSDIIDGLVNIYLEDILGQNPNEQAKAISAGKINDKKNNEHSETSDESANNNNEQGATDKLDDEHDGGSISSTLASSYGNAEYIDHPLAIIGHQYMQGGAGEGRQLLGPDGTFENVQVIKTDRAVPSYCDPPNPCPIGYKAADGCLENFINSASFSREYQAKQQCSCDNEHSLFNCASPVSTMKNELYSSVEPSGESNSEEISISSNNGQISDSGHDADEHHGTKLDTLARTIQNRFGDLDSVRNLITGSKERDETGLEKEILISRVAKKAPRIESDFRY